jgi:hypothetical protein
MWLGPLATTPNPVQSSKASPKFGPQTEEDNLRKAIYIGAALLLAFASANAVSRKQSSIHVVYQPTENGDFRLFLFGSDRTLVCEEKAITIVSQGDAENPVVLECKHK